MIVDCDDLVGMWGSFWNSRPLINRPRRVGVGVSQPKTRDCCRGKECKLGRVCGHGMAHTFNVLDLGTSFKPGSLFQGTLIESHPLREWLAKEGDQESDGVWVWDGSVGAGMNETGPEFFGSGESSVLWMPSTRWPFAA